MLFKLTEKPQQVKHDPWVSGAMLVQGEMETGFPIQWSLQNIEETPQWADWSCCLGTPELWGAQFGSDCAEKHGRLLTSR